MISTDKEIERWINKVGKAGSRVNKRSVRNKGAQVIKKAAKASVKSAHPKKGRKPIGYANGKVYHPGNLDRSILLLTNIKSKNVTYVGPKLNHGGPVFRGSSYDGYYAHMLERGTKKGINGTHWFETGVKTAERPARRAMAVKAIEVLRKEGMRLGIR